MKADATIRGSNEVPDMGARGKLACECYGNIEQQSQRIGCGACSPSASDVSWLAYEDANQGFKEVGLAQESALAGEIVIGCRQQEVSGGDVGISAAIVSNRAFVNNEHFVKNIRIFLIVLDRCHDRYKFHYSSKSRNSHADGYPALWLRSD
jgi:hypothetical protein